jgi:cobalt-precorrin 5A hydrolase/precorrin-3B C17-methyltransferase
MHRGKQTGFAQVRGKQPCLRLLGADAVRTPEQKVFCLTLTAAGAAVARRLPYEHRHGNVAETIRAEWHRAGGFVIVGSTGIAVRAVSGLLASKQQDPAVVSIDERARWAVSLAGGHHGANELCREVATLLGAEAVITTASEAAGVPPLDSLTGYTSEGDLASVARRWLDGEPPELWVDPALGAWPVPPVLANLDHRPDPRSSRITITDSNRSHQADEVLLRPLSLVVGAGASSGADPTEAGALLQRALVEAGLHPSSVGAVATIDIKASEPALVQLARSLRAELRTFSSAQLKAASATAGITSPSAAVERAVGTPSVAEAACLLAAGQGAELVVPKLVTKGSTIAVARRARPAGCLLVVGLGPGGASSRTIEATSAVRHAEVVIGYGPYVDQASDLLSDNQVVLRYPIGSEVERCQEALRRAAAGEVVALVCSGDPGIYAMASLACELAPMAGCPPMKVLPGVTAAQAAAAALGAPLGHDHAAISLSDLLTPWSQIEARLDATAAAGLAIALYNPRSAGRPYRLAQAMKIIGRHLPPDVPAAVVTDAGRPTERVMRTTLGTLDPVAVGMRSIVIVGSASSRWICGQMVTPRGYSR